MSGFTEWRILAGEDGDLFVESRDETGRVRRWHAQEERVVVERSEDSSENP